MKKIKNLILVLALFMCFNRCKQNPESEEFMKHSDQFSVEQAEAWFGSEWIGALNLKSGDTKAKINIKPDWCDGFTSQNSEAEVVEVGLFSQGYFGFAEKALFDDWKTSRVPNLIRSLTRMVFLKYKKDGHIVPFLMTIVGNKEYLDKKIGRLADNSYFKKQSHFSGYILYHDLNGRFVNGWFYEKGKLAGSTKQNSPVDLPIQLKSGTICTTTYLTTWYYDQYTWIQTNNLDGSHTMHSFDGDPYYEITAYTTCTFVSDPNANSDGAGGYNPAPSPTTCNCEVCPICSKCLNNALKSANISDPCSYCTGHPDPNIDIDGYNQLNNTEKELIKEFPLQAIEISNNRQKATDVTINLFGHNGRNDCSDAFRHAYFQAINTISIGEYLTKRFSDAHESETPENLLLEKQMDLYNNSIGIYIGLNCNGCEVASKIMDYLKSGQLYFLSPINYNDQNFNSNGGITNETKLISTLNCN